MAATRPSSSSAEKLGAPALSWTSDASSDDTEQGDNGDSGAGASPGDHFGT